MYMLKCCGQNHSAPPPKFKHTAYCKDDQVWCFSFSFYLEMVKNTKFNRNLTVQAVSIREGKCYYETNKKRLAANDFSFNAGESDDSSVGHKAPRRVTH